MQMLPLNRPAGKELFLVIPYGYWISADSYFSIPTICIDKYQQIKTIMPFILLHRLYIFFPVFFKILSAQLIGPVKRVFNSTMWNKLVEKSADFRKFAYDLSYYTQKLLVANSILLNKNALFIIV